MSEIIIKYKDKEYTYNYDNKEAKSQKVKLRNKIKDEEIKKKLNKQKRINKLLEEQKKLLEQSNNDYINDILDNKKSIIKKYKELLKKEDILFFKLNKIEKRLNILQYKYEDKKRKKEYYIKTRKKRIKYSSEYRNKNRLEIRKKQNAKNKLIREQAKNGDIEAIEYLKRKQKINNENHKKHKQLLKELVLKGDPIAIEKQKILKEKSIIYHQRWKEKLQKRIEAGEEQAIKVKENIKKSMFNNSMRIYNKKMELLKQNDKESYLWYKKRNKTRKQWRQNNKEKVLKQKLESQKKAHKGLKDNIYLFFNKINKTFNEKRFRKDFQDFLTDLSNKIMNKNIDKEDKKNLSVLRNSIINVYMFNFIKKYLFLGDLKPITYEIKESEK